MRFDGKIMKMGQHADIGSGQVTAKVAVKKMGQQIMKPFGIFISVFANL